MCIPKIFFPLYTLVVHPIYAPTTSLKLMELRKIRVEEGLFSKGASIRIKQAVNQPSWF